MKNGLIAALATYIYYTDLCVIKAWYLMPFIFLLIWGLMSEAEDLIREYRESVRRGQKLQRKIKKAERSW